MNDKEERYQARMARKKALIDAAIAAKDQDQGVMVLLTGNGKGKSSSAFGMVARAIGHQMKVGVVQFIKSRTDTGEEAFLGQYCEWHVMGDGFTWDTQNKESDTRKSLEAWAMASKMLSDASYDLVVLDELTYCLNYGYLDPDTICDALSLRPAKQHVVVTGRAACDNLKSVADTVTMMESPKHAYDQGVRAQKGLEW